MPSQNVEAVRAVYEAFATWDLDAAFRHLDPQVEVRLPSIYPEGPETLRGREGAERWRAMIQDTWGEWRFEPERLIEAGDKVVALVRIVAEGGASQVRLDREVAHVWAMDQGRATSIEVYLDPAEGLRAAGLPAGAADS
jgi:ketosteroid isomerase-like protein